MLALAGDLSEVCYAKHLPFRRELSESTPDDLRDAATDPRINFVKHQCRDRARTRSEDFERQADAR